MTNDQLIQCLESAANFLRGLSMDPALPNHVREAVLVKSEQLDAIVQKALKDEQ